MDVDVAEYHNHGTVDSVYGGKVEVSVVIKIEVSDDELKDAVLSVIAERYCKDYSTDRRHVRMVTQECVREIIYKDKENIIKQIVSQASRECGNKAVKKILEVAL